MTVAVRGTEVNVALRTSDDATASALSRNAATLDHALRARGLELGELNARQHDRESRESARESRDRDRAHERERARAPRFALALAREEAA
jgi:hypothetical protein